MSATTATQGFSYPGGPYVLSPVPVIKNGALVVNVIPSRGAAEAADAGRGTLTTDRLSGQTVAAIARAKPRLVALVDDRGGRAGESRLAGDGLRLMERCRVPVLLLRAGAACPGDGRVVVAAPCRSARSPAAADALAHVLDHRSREVIVLSVAAPFRPVWCRVAPAMRGEQAQALHEVWLEQAAQATDNARDLASRLSAAGMRPVYLGAAGPFAGEVGKVAGAGATALVCLLGGAGRRGDTGRATVCDVMRGTGAPVLLVPPGVPDAR